MADAAKSLSGLLSGIVQNVYYEKEEMTEDLLRTELFPDLSEQDFRLLFDKMSGLLKSIATADMDHAQLEAFLTAQSRKQGSGGVTPEQAAALSRLWRSHRGRVRDSLLARSRWDNKTIDLLYANTKDAYTATALPPLGTSDHNLVQLTPRYVPAVKRLPVATRSVRRSTQEADMALQDCFESTDWDALCMPHGDDINAMTDCITDYIKFCEHTVLPARTVSSYPNNKPWITRDLKALLNKKKEAFRCGDQEELRGVQGQLKEMLKQGKDDYRRKLESKLQQNNTREVWSGMKTITGFNVKEKPTEGTVARANQLNLFFNRFSSRSSTQPTAASSTQHTSLPPTLPTETSTVTETFTTTQVRRQLERLQQNKAAGPDGLSPRLLRTCATQLAAVLQQLFNLSLQQGMVPALWKTSCLVPVPKTRSASSCDPKDFRPVALTSHVMKVLERLVLSHLRPQCRSARTCPAGRTSS